MTRTGKLSPKRKKGLAVVGLVMGILGPQATQEEIHERVVRDANDWKKLFDWSIPERASLSWVKQYIRDIQNAEKQKWLDSPWHTGIFAVHDKHELEIPLDQLSVVMETAMRAFAGGKRLTTREAMWVARLNALMQINPDQATDNEIENIYGLAVAYSARERASRAATFVTSSGHSVLTAEQESERDTWPLDVFVALTESVIAPAWPLYEVLIEAEYTTEPIWPTGPAVRMGITPTSDEVKPLYDLLFDAVSELAGSCKAMISALLWLRAYAEEQIEFVAKSGESAVNFTDVSPSGVSYPPITNPVQFWEAARDAPKWDALPPTKQREMAREIGNRVMKEINAEKCEAERVQAEQQTETAREIALQVMGLIDRQKGIENDD